MSRGPAVVVTDEPRALNPGFIRSLVAWGVLIGAGLIYVLFKIAPSPAVRNVLLLMLVLEAITIIDRWAGNTLSEAMWFLSRRPLVPMLFGIFLGWPIGLGWIDPFSVAIGMLYGHFFWQEHKEDRHGPQQP